MSDSEDDCNEKQMKIVILGEPNVGKTNLIKKFCYDEFSRLYIPTIGADFYIKRINLTGSREVIVRLTDVGGSELNGHMMDTYLFKVDMVILVYDITNVDSLNLLITWLRKIDQILENEVENRSFLIAVLGNKCDLEHKRTVKLDATNHFIEDNKLSNFFVSAKTGENVNSSFVELIAQYFNIKLTSSEKDKQRAVIRAELVSNTPSMIQQQKSRQQINRNKTKNLKKTANKVSIIKKKTPQSCIIQ